MLACPRRDLCWTTFSSSTDGERQHRSNDQEDHHQRRHNQGKESTLASSWVDARRDETYDRENKCCEHHGDVDESEQHGKPRILTGEEPDNGAHTECKDERGRSSTPTIESQYNFDTTDAGSEATTPTQVHNNVRAKRTPAEVGAAWMHTLTWGSFIVTGILIASLLPWLSEGLLSGSDAAASAADFLTRLSIVTGVLTVLGGVARLIGHDEQTPNKPIDALGKALALWAALFATSYGIIFYWALHR